MRFPLRAGLAATTFLMILSAFLLGSRDVSAAAPPPPGPDRYAVVTEEYTNYIWWLARWSDSVVACQIEIDHEGLPIGGEVFDACGQSLYDKWLATQPCAASASDPGSCSGYYLHLFTSEIATRQVAVALSPPVVWVTVDGCIPYASSYRCDSLPTLVLTGEEPLAGYSITSLEGTVGEELFKCDPVCQVDLVPTDAKGLVIKFWAYSSYGDSSQAFEARVRVSGSDDPNNSYWYVDVLTTQWRGAPPAPCGQDWKAFPPVGGLTGWLASPDTPGELASNISYEYLAGNLISHGAVDASTCADGGLLENGYASACGSEVARPAVDEWQNRFDTIIFTAAREIGVPAQLLKNIFSRESQFWPGVTPQRPEAGLGQLTDNGADTLLIWNPAFYEQFCPTVLDQDICKNRFYFAVEDEDFQAYEMSEEERALLRTALVMSVDAFCPDCPLGIDLNEAETSVSIFAETLLANCAQTGMVVDLNFVNPNPPPSYEDLWRFTLVNYNAGPGCLGLAVDATARAGQALNWEYVSSHFTPACSGALDYVNDVASTSP
jgi:hypothetical protein